MTSPEHWQVDAGDRDVAQLDIPPDARRDRRFEISCSFQVAWHGSASGDAADADAEAAAWHSLTIRVDGVQAWSRRVATHPGGDSLDYRFRRRVEAGERLRLIATTRVHRATRIRLVVSAEEEA